MAFGKWILIAFALGWVSCWNTTFAQVADSAIPSEGRPATSGSTPDHEPALTGSADESALTGEVKLLFQQHCFDCHGGGANEGELQLDQLLLQPASDATRQVWWKVLSNVRAGTMPPPDSGHRLERPQRQSVGQWIQFQSLGIDPAQPDPGRVTLRRLNRREYANTIRDLFGIDFNAEIVFPPDDTGFGFDNIGDALSLSPLVVEKYLAAASQIVREAVPNVDWVMPEHRLTAGEIRGDEGRNADNMRMNRPHRVSCLLTVTDPGSYTLEIVMKSGGSFEFSPQRCQVVCRLDGEVLFEEQYGWDEAKRDRRFFERKWQPGEYPLAFEVTPIELPPKESPQKGKEEGFADLDVEFVSLRGPHERELWQHPRGYDRVFTRDRAPEDAAGRDDYAREIFQRLGERVFRRPIDAPTLDRLVNLVRERLDAPESTFESAVSSAIVPMLASPRFLFRMESPIDSQTLEPYPLVDEYSLASRLSYFLWSTMPDESLLSLARQGQLRVQLQPTVDRMLADPRSQALVRNFVGQWLRTRDVEKTSIDPLAVYQLQPEFDELLAWVRRNRAGRVRSANADTPADPDSDRRRERFEELKKVQDLWSAEIRNAMRRETEMLFEHIATENRDLVEIIDPGYTFLNERLAKHYGIEGVRGPQMRRVDLPAGSQRGGVLTHGTMLTVTSNPTRTSPVKRGLYLLENILGTPTPPAPPNVPALEDAADRFKGREPSLKELLAAHREASLCSSCHSRMDPLGLALENFDALGVWRDQEKDQPIDASGQLITGESFRDFRDLRRIIATERREDFYRCISQKMLVYALGRGTEYYDEVTLDRLVERLMNQQGHFRELIHGIIDSAPFQRQRRAPALEP